MIVWVQYVCLTDIEPVLRKTHISGTTNMLFETKTDWYDVVGSFTTGAVVHQSNIKISGQDRNHIKNVLSGVEDNKGELWAREQFRIYTEKFLKSVENEKLKGQQKKWLGSFSQCELYTRYLENRDNMDDGDSKDMEAIEYLKMLQDTESELGVLEKTKVVFDLQKNLVNLSSIEEVCDADGVATVAQGLSESSAQVRKYSAVALSQLAVSIKGQIAILSGDVLDRVIEKVKDPMPNVVNAACTCLMKISTLFIGVHALVERGVVDLCGELLSAGEDGNLVVKTRAAATLLQIYRFCPTAKRLDVAMIREQCESPDRSYTTLLFQLLDLWEEPIPDFVLSSSMEQHLQALQAEETETRTQATSYLLSDLVANPEMVIELVKGGGIDILLENESLRAPEDKLSRFSFAVLGLVADSFAGRQLLMGKGVIQRALDGLKDATCPLYLFYVARFFEVICQHPETCEKFIELDGLDALIPFIGENINKDTLNTLCLPSLGAIKFLLLSTPRQSDEVRMALDAVDLRKWSVVDPKERDAEVIPSL
eukprot:TRINITY_DN2935_c0_g1_i1.p1 TRINITY_DN2935_c0_g1~~TRINITY_DN2935_c0_g1_i1.p1  ORF type:complete len:539 (-),score=148.40 TRINITY_DN2935_c0_g1_i1:389-2005(-)